MCGTKKPVLPGFISFDCGQAQISSKKRHTCLHFLKK